MGNNSTTNKSFNDPDDGEYARKRLGSWLSSNWGDLDTILGRLERQEDTISSGSTAAISGGENVLALAVVLDESNNAVGLFSLEGGSQSTTELAESGTHFGASSGSGNNVDVYNDSNGDYVVDNQSGSEATFETIMLRAV